MTRENNEEERVTKYHDGTILNFEHIYLCSIY